MQLGGAVSQLHQQSKNCTNKAKTAPTKQKLHQQSKNCTNKASSAPTKHNTN